MAEKQLPASEQKSPGFPTKLIRLFVLLFLFMSLGSLFLLRSQLGAPRSAVLPDLGIVPDFQLTERSGNRFSRNDLTGSVWIANFIFTRCPGLCPLLSTRMATLQQQLQIQEGRSVRLVSFSVDPEWDTPERLREYADRYQAHADRWVFLTGPPQAMLSLIIQGFRLGVETAPVGSKEPIIHSDRLVLVDSSFRIRGYYHGTDQEDFNKLQRDVGVLLHE